MDTKELLSKVNSELKEMGTKTAIAYWNLATTGKPEYANDVEKAEITLRMYLANSELFEQVKNALSEENDEIDTRQLRLLFNSMLPNQLSKEAIQETVKREVEIEGIFANYRAKIDGKEVTNNDISEILTKSSDSLLRKKAWVAGKEIGQEIAPRLIELIKLRNENAKTLGFNNYYDMMMELSELSTEQIHSMFRDFKEQTDGIFTEIKSDIDSTLAKKYEVEKTDIAPWHYGDLWFQEVPEIDDFNYDAIFKNKDIAELVKKTYDSIGLDIRDILAKSDLYERKGKNQHAFTISINRTDDVRVLENIKPNIKWAETTLHEYGHAVYDKYIRKDIPYLLREPAHIFTTEAVAMFFGRRARDAEWYGKIVNVSNNTLKEIEHRLEKLLKYQLAITARWVIAFVFFEKELYRDPEGDLNNLWYDIVHELQYVNVPKERRQFPDWAAKIHFGSSPVYYHNYLLGEMTASQFEHYIKNNIGDSLIDRRAGEFFVENIFKPGSMYRWDELIDKGTGEALNPAFLVEQIK
ncbi:MAG: M2 family metallopeptidase [Caldisericaceae bacterium]